MTADIDVLIEATIENARHNLAGLADVGYDVTGLSDSELLRKKILLRQYILAKDIHPSVKGVSFGTVWRHRVKDTIEGVPVNVAGLDDLIKMKRAANRPKDQDDLVALREIRGRQKKNKGNGLQDSRKGRKKQKRGAARGAVPSHSSPASQNEFTQLPGLVSTAVYLELGRLKSGAPLLSIPTNSILNDHRTELCVHRCRFWNGSFDVLIGGGFTRGVGCGARPQTRN